MTRHPKSPARFVSGPLFAAILVLALAAAAACGGDGGKAAPSPKASVSPAQGAQGTPGAITISFVSPIVGQNDKMLLISANAENGGPQIARACVPITSDNFAVPETAMTDMPAGQNPCGGSTPRTVFQKGTYCARASTPRRPASRRRYQTRQCRSSVTRPRR